MSYADMPHNFEEILENLANGSLELNSLSHFFKGIRSAYDTFSIELNKVSDNFKVLKPESSLSKSMHSLKRYFKQIVSYQLTFLNSIQTDIIEPLDLFLEHFNSNNAELRERGESLSMPMKAAQKDLKKHKELYYSNSENLEKLERTLINENNKLQINAQKKYYAAQTKANRENYIRAVEEASIFCEIFESEMPAIMESLQQNEESRIHFIKSSSEKYIRFYQRNLESCTIGLNDFSNNLNVVNSAFDIKNFIGRLQNPLIIKEEFVEYTTWKAKKRIEDLSDNDIVNSVIDFLILKSSEKFVDFEKLNLILMTKEGKDMFIQGLDFRKQNDLIDIENFFKLGEILKKIIVSLEDDEASQMHFCKIIALSHVFYTEINGQKSYLTDVLKQEKIWDNEKRWINAIKLAINAKLLADKEIMQKSINAKKKQGIFSTIKDLAQKIPLAGKEKPIEKSEKSSAYNILSHFTYQMSNLNVSSQIAHLIIMKIAETYSFESDRICTLLSQIQLVRNFSSPKKKLLKISAGYIFKLSFEFLSMKECLEMICVNQETNKLLSGLVTYWWIGKSKGETQLILRKAHWTNQLKSFFPITDYEAILEKVTNKIELIGEINEIIDMDICRSYQDRLDIHQNLRNILKTYAYYNPDVSYCQGMNFIAGTLYLLFKDEGLSFKCLIGLVKKFGMDPIFAEGLPKLRTMLYQLDQIIEIKLPNVQKFFKAEGISAGLFSSSWFLTLFSSNLQNKIPVLLQIWDYFLIKGWKVIFKASIAILSIMEKKICSGSFDEIMSLMTGANLYSERVFNEEFIDKVKQVKISNKLLSHIENDYDGIVLLSTRSSVA